MEILAHLLTQGGKPYRAHPQNTQSLSNLLRLICWTLTQATKYCILQPARAFVSERISVKKILRSAHPVNHFSRFLGKNIQNCPPS